MVSILSIDGGGIRGLLPSLVLAEIRRRLNGLGEYRPFWSLFDLIAGTSTGALIALALSLRNHDGTERFTAADIVDLYRRRGTEIFPLSFHSAFHTAVQAFRHKYRAEPFEGLLREVFAHASLQSAATNMLLTSFDTEAMRPHCMKRRPLRDDLPRESDYYMCDVARASAAAPTYFPPANISPIDEPGRRFSLIDGAMFANNPSGLAYVEATTIYPSESDFLILSLGTGEPQNGYPYDEVHSWGYLEWVNPRKGFPIGAIMSAGQSEAVSNQLTRLDGVRYVRLNISLGDCSKAMDDARSGNLACLTVLAERMITRFSETIDQVCKTLSGRHVAIR